MRRSDFKKGSKDILSVLDTLFPSKRSNEFTSTSHSILNTLQENKFFSPPSFD